MAIQNELIFLNRLSRAQSITNKQKRHFEFLRHLELKAHFTEIEHIMKNVDNVILKLKLYLKKMLEPAQNGIYLQIRMRID
jgi:hypothetical protein